MFSLTSLKSQRFWLVDFDPFCLFLCCKVRRAWSSCLVIDVVCFEDFLIFLILVSCKNKAMPGFFPRQNSTHHRDSSYPVPGVRIVEFGAKEESEKKTRWKRGRGGNAWKICFQKVIPPTLSASNPNAVSGIKSCQSSNGRKTTLFTEFKKKYECIHLSYFFSANEYIPYLQKWKKLASITRSTFSAVDFHSTDHILAAVGFCGYYWNAVWIFLSVKDVLRE